MPDQFTPPGKSESSAENGRIVVEHYLTLVGGDADDVRTNLVDLLADLLHLASAEGLDVDDVIDDGRAHCLAEL